MDEAAAWDGKGRVKPKLVAVPLGEAGFSAAISFSPSGVYYVENDNVGLAENLDDRIEPITLDFSPIKIKGVQKKEHKKKLKEEALAYLLSLAGDRPIGKTGYTLRILDSKNRGKRTTYNVDKQARSEAFRKLEEVIDKAYHLSSALPENKQNESRTRENKLARTASIERFGFPAIINRESCIVWFTAQTREAGDKGVLLDEFGVTERKKTETASRLSASGAKFQGAVSDELTLGDYLANVNDELRDMPKITKRKIGDSDFSSALRFEDSSTLGHSALTEGHMAFAQTIAENVSKMLAEEVARFRDFDGKVQGSREKALVAIGAVYNMARSVSLLMPAGYRVNVRPYLNQLQVFAELAATGDLDLTAEMASQKVRDLLRHSFGTYYRAKVGSLTQTADQMGNSVAVCNKRYSRPVLQAEGEAYFNIWPNGTRPH